VLAPLDRLLVFTGNEASQLANREASSRGCAPCRSAHPMDPAFLNPLHGTQHCI
jgi:hypothetical protein